MQGHLSTLSAVPSVSLHAQAARVINHNKFCRLLCKGVDRVVDFWYTHRMKTESTVTTMSDAQICAGLRLHSSNFAASLLAGYARWGSFTVRQRVCALAMVQIAAAAPATPVVGEYLGIVGAFATARGSGLKRPQLRFTVGGVKVALSLAPSVRNGENHPNAGCVYVKYDGIYCGKITPQGVFSAAWGNPAPQECMAFLAAFAANPTLVGGQAGRETGCCCFCGLTLTDGRSVVKGYGPVCAKNWALPWGE